MKGWKQPVSVATVAVIVSAASMANAFIPTPRPSAPTLALTAETVQVCGFKDCRRAGGGKRLENVINSVRVSVGIMAIVARCFLLAFLPVRVSTIIYHIDLSTSPSCRCCYHTTNRSWKKKA
jgi:hypothetical protein